jgi:hypothetical protein
MDLIKRLTAIAISVGLGLIFLYSGYAKLLPIIETFEMTFVETGIANWYTAPVIARLLIGLEFFLGILLLVNYNLKKFTLPFTIGILLFFIIYLLVQVYLKGNEGNCGCFGERIRMTPLMAVSKNFFMILGCLLIYLLPAGWKLRRNYLFLLLVAFPTVALPFILNPIDFKYTSNNLEEKVNYPLELDLLYEPEDSSKVEIPAIELRKGRHLLAFMSLTCRHCRIAGKKLQLMKENNPSISIYFVLNGSRDNLPAFLAETGATDIPSSFCLGKTFIRLASANLPRIYYLDNGVVVKKVDYIELNQYSVEHWLKTGETDK